MSQRASNDTAEDLAEQRLAAERANARLARREAARRYGGLDLPASFGGALAALGVAVLLGSLAASIGWFGYGPTDPNVTVELSVAGLVAGALALFVAFLVGGWVAGRMARYDGGRNGLMTAIWFIVLVAIAAVAGALADQEYDVLRTVQAPRWLSDNAWTAGGVAAIAGAVVVMLVGAFAGGRVGQRYHRRADNVVAATGARHELDRNIDLRDPRDPATRPAVTTHDHDGRRADVRAD